MTTFRRLALAMALSATLPVVSAYAGPIRLGISHKTHLDPPGARVEWVQNGHPAQFCSRPGDNTRYYLAAGLHVITKVNGVPIGNSSDLNNAIQGSPRQARLLVYNLQTSSAREYRVTLNGEPQSNAWYAARLKEGTSAWRPGKRHSRHSNVVASTSEDQWHPAPGYRWKSKPDWTTTWNPGETHPDFPIYAASKEGSWSLKPGYNWVTGLRGDLRATWRPGKRHPSHAVIAKSTEGSWTPASGYHWVNSQAGDLRVARNSSSSSSSRRTAQRPSYRAPAVSNSREAYLRALRQLRSSERLADEMNRWVDDSNRIPLNSSSY